MSDSFMFKGESINNRLSNEIWLAKNCPPEFYDSENAWNRYCQQAFEQGCDIWTWQLKQLDTAVDRCKVTRFLEMLQAYMSQLHREERIAILAWMLSETVIEVPEYHPALPDRIFYA